MSTRLDAAIEHLTEQRDLYASAIEVLQAVRRAGSPAAAVAPAAARGRKPAESRRGAARRSSSTRKARVTRGAKGAARTPESRPAIGPSPGASTTGRQPSAITVASRSTALTVLAKHPAAMTFRELLTAVAPALVAEGVKQETLQIEVLGQATTFLRQKGFIKRISGAWTITDDGRAEVVRLREATKAAAAR